MIITNRGKRIFLRQALPEDAEMFYEAYSSDDFSRLFRSNSDQQKLDDVRKSLTERASMSPESLGYLEFSIILDNTVIGVAVLADYSPIHKRAEYLIGIFSKNHRNTFYAIETTLLILDLAFNHYGINKIYSYVYEYNQYSNQIMNKFGFKQEGFLEDHHFSIKEERFVSLHFNGLTEKNFRRSEKISSLSRKLLDMDITQQVTALTVVHSLL